ncbi:MAG: DUF6612 family protein [Bacillota bacterium]
MRKRCIAFTAALLAFFILFAGTAQALTVNELLQSATEKMETATGFTAKSTVDLNMSVQDEKLAIRIVSDIKFVRDPLLLKMKNTVTVDNERQKSEIYAQLEENELAIYTVMGKAVSRAALPMTEDALAQSTAAALSEQYLDSYKELKYFGKDKINGKHVYVLTARLDATAVRDQVESSMTGDILDAIGTQYLDAILSSMDDVPVTLYIQQSTRQFVRIEIDMSELMNTVFEKIGTLAEETSGMKVDRYFITVDMSNINKVKPFKIPASVMKAAQDAA